TAYRLQDLLPLLARCRDEIAEQVIVRVRVRIGVIAEADRELILVMKTLPVHGQAISGERVPKSIQDRLRRDDRILEPAIGDLLNDGPIELAFSPIVRGRGGVRKNGSKQIHDSSDELKSPASSPSLRASRLLE